MVAIVARRFMQPEMGHVRDKEDGSEGEGDESEGEGDNIVGPAEAVAVAEDEG